MLLIKGEGKKIEWILKEYRKKVDKSQQLKRLRDLQEFVKPSIKRRKEKQRAKYNSKYNDSKL
jgi:small subunit ribosomal protein S21